MGFNFEKTPSRTQKLDVMFPIFSLAFLLFPSLSATTIAESQLVTSSKFQTHFGESSNFLAHYSKHCNHTVPFSPPLEHGRHINPRSGETSSLHFSIAYISGGHQILPEQSSNDSPSVFLSFRPQGDLISVRKNISIFKLDAMLKFRKSFQFSSILDRKPKLFKVRRPKIPLQSRSLVFQLNGFWSKNTGRLCMLGPGFSVGGLGPQIRLNVVLKLNYPVEFSAFRSLITGRLESLDDPHDSGYFDRISIVGIPQFGQYRYNLVNKWNTNVCASGDGDHAGGGDESLQVQLMDKKTCLNQLVRYGRGFDLDYSHDCGGNDANKCNFMSSASGGTLPNFMAIREIRCDNGSFARTLLKFSHYDRDGHHPFGYDTIVNPALVLIGEGSWDKNGHFCLIACRFLNSNDTNNNYSIGDCSIRLNLRLSKSLTIRNRSVLVGEITSNKTVNGTGYFNAISFHSSQSGARISGLHGVEYKYTVLDRVYAYCPKQIINGKGNTYPSGHSSDLGFHVSVRNGKGQVAYGYSSPFFVGNELYEPYRMSKHNDHIMSISYKISLQTNSKFELGDKILSNKPVEIASEGMYNRQTGFLCMVGCWHWNSTDCEILIVMQFPPLNMKHGAKIQGNITSMRKKLDPHYFEQLQLSSTSMYNMKQAKESIWRVNVEMTLVLISNTLASLFAGLQLYHVKKYPDKLPLISIIMLMILTISHAIPIALNLETLLHKNNHPRNIFLASGEWFEVNQVMVRVVSIVAFLLHSRLFQLTWCARKQDEHHMLLWNSEKTVAFFMLPVYLCGFVIAWLADYLKNQNQKPLLHLLYQTHRQPSVWRDGKSAAGLMLDGVLLPQIILNFVLNSKEDVLSCPFYAGMTFLHLLPHAYEVYKTRTYSQYRVFFNLLVESYGRRNSYSAHLSIIFPSIISLVFAIIVCLQQRYGGRCIVPKRFRGISGYERVLILDDSELQEF